MAWGQGTSAADADAYGGNQGIDAAEAAGGPENEATEMDIASALADALAGANVDDFGAYAAQDIQNIEDQGMAFNEQQAAERQALADRIAEIDAAIAGSTAAGSAGPGTTDAASNPFAGPAQGVVEDFTGGNPYAEQQIAANEFADWQQPGSPTDPLGSAAGLSAASSAAGPAIEEAQMGMAAPMGQTAPAQGYQDILGSNTGLAQATQFDQTQQGHPDFPGSAGVFGTGVEDFTGGGMPQVAPVGVEEMEMGMAAPMGQGGMIGQYDATMGATAGAPVMSGPQEASADQQGGLISAGAPATAATAATAGTAGTAGTGFFGDDQNVGVAADSPAGQRMTEKEVNVYGKMQVDQSIMDTAAMLDQKAKALREKHGLFNKDYQKAQRMANAFKSLDQYSKAYSATQGGSFMGQLLSGAMPFGSAFKAMQGWLTSKGIYSKEMGQDLLGILQKAQDEGNLNSVMRDLQGGGPSDEDVEGPKEISAFIEQYPWASELDPKYIKYLIDNPAALQDLLGQGPGGGDQETQGV